MNRHEFEAIFYFEVHSNSIGIFLFPIYIVFNNFWSKLFTCYEYVVRDILTKHDPLWEFKLLYQSGYICCYADVKEFWRII